MKNISLRRDVPLLAAALVLLAGPSVVEAQLIADGPPAPALLSVYSGGVQFQPSVGFSQATLSVSGGDVSFRQMFADGEYPSIGRYDPEGNSLADGTYSWELILKADPATAMALRVAATQNGGKAPNAWQAQSGTFTIQGGSFVSPDVVEPGAAQARIESSGTLSTMGASSFGSRGRSSEDSDGSSVSEAQVRAAATASLATASAYGAGLQAFDRGGVDSDGNSLALGQSLEAPVAAAIQSIQTEGSLGASIAQKSTDPAGKHGRPTADK